jgi:hypothetical protein
LQKTIAGRRSKEVRATLPLQYIKFCLVGNNTFAIKAYISMFVALLWELSRATFPKIFLSSTRKLS